MRPISYAGKLTVVIVGSSRSRVLAYAGETRVFTPRGYAAKRQAAAGGA